MVVVYGFRGGLKKIWENVLTGLGSWCLMVCTAAGWVVVEKREKRERMEECNGWANRETWAFVLHCENTIGAEFFISGCIEIDDDSTDWQVGSDVIELVQSMWDDDRANDWVSLMRDDVGSVWRIDEREVGAWAREYAEEFARYAS